MAFSGQVLDNPVSGERFIFRRSADDTAGELLTFDMVVDPHGRVPGGHVHPTQQERFEILIGTMKFRKGLRTVIAGPGDTVVVPPGDFHKFANAGDEPAVVRVTIEPALRMEQLFETVAKLAEEGRIFRSGLPKPLDLALFMRDFEAEVQAPVATGLVRVVTAPLAWLASHRGLDHRYSAPPAVPVRRSAPVRRAAPTHPGIGQVSGTGPAPSRPYPSRPGGASLAHRRSRSGRPAGAGSPRHSAGR